MKSKAILATSRAAMWIVVVVGVFFSVAARGQSDERKPPPATKGQAKKDDSTRPPRTAQPASREKPRSGERIRLDAPVSFPVDI